MNFIKLFLFVAERNSSVDYKLDQRNKNNGKDFGCHNIDSQPSAGVKNQCG